MKVGSILLTGLGAAALAGGVAFALLQGDDEQAEAAEPEAPVVEVVRPEPLDAAPAIVTTGFVRAADALDVTAQVAGEVSEVSPDFEIGRIVPAETPLVRLASTTFEAELAQAESALAGAEAAQRDARNSLDRQEELAREDFASEATIEQLSAAVAGAEADVASARAAIVLAEERLSDTQISVPFDAIVLGADAPPGSVVQPGRILGRVARADHAELRTALTEAEFTQFTNAGVLQDTDITFSVQGGETARTARIFSVSPQLEAQTRLIEVLARIEQPFAGDAPLVLNQLVDVEVPLPGPREQLYALPARALLPGQELWRIGDEDTLVPVAYTLQRRVGGRVIVQAEDLTPDTPILVTPLQTLAEGIAVRVEDAQEAGQGAGG
ncbi:efflux RND transporter periplasmic adaptor subunit [Pseudaestuariivita sp.]|uniref:efflux RND transporter periplasmic adaptor subunit n=1 Tax=Pseudaestuariivita sp. TaxID=2211669 RepID=UPI004059DAAA